MKIAEVITRVKQYHRGIFKGQKIDENTTRDQILYGDASLECTGIVTTIYASPEVIKKAAEKGANLIICHEACFWNHGDHTDWLRDTGNTAFSKKTKLLDEYKITVWRDHDYIHSGIPMEDMPEGYTDGIFYGFAKEIGWDKYIIDDPVRPVLYEIPQTTVSQIAEKMLATFHLTGFKVIGNQNANVKKVWIPGHILEGNPRSDEMISYIQNNNINLILPLELIDFTVAEYVRDSALLGENRAIISMGHFNLEEPGMRYMCTYLKEAIDQDIPCTFIQAGDMYRYITR